MVRPRGYKLEACLLEHGCGAVGGLVSEGASLPAIDWVGFDQAAAFFPDGLESGFERGGGDAALTIVLENGKAGDSPELLCAGRGSQASILAAVVDARKLLLGLARGDPG
jgi:hypothetical protein